MTMEVTLLDVKEAFLHRQLRVFQTQLGAPKGQSGRLLAADANGPSDKTVEEAIDKCKRHDRGGEHHFLNTKRDQ